MNEKMSKWIEEVGALKKEIDVIIERQSAVENLKENESVLKEEALVELECVREQLSASISDCQQAIEGSEKHESMLQS